jgi:hypothetical protein
MTTKWQQHSMTTAQTWLGTDNKGKKVGGLFAVLTFSHSALEQHLHTAGDREEIHIPK